MKLILIVVLYSLINCTLGILFVAGINQTLDWVNPFAVWLLLFVFPWAFLMNVAWIQNRDQFRDQR